jgi:RNA polymerase I-specific transcription initiation factor RRN3
MADSSDEGPTAASPTEVTADCSWMVSAAADALTKKAQAGAEENPERKRELCKYYDELVESVNDSEDTVSMCGWLAALTQCVSKITDDCSRLLAAVLSREWAGSATTATKFTTFLCHLVSANGCFVEAALGVLVQHMLPREGALDVEFVSDIVHDANFQILRIFPASSGCLSRLLQDNFPHKRLSAATHATYLRNVLRIVTCAPALQNDVLRCVVGKCIQLDVDIKMDDLGEDEEEEDEVVPFQMDEMEDTAAGGDSKHEKSAAETETEKLDEMMDLLFAFIKRQCSDRSEAGRKQAENIFKILMRIFHSMILTTHNSKFVQYLMFFICSLNPEFTDAFLQATGDAAVSTVRLSAA